VCSSDLAEKYRKDKTLAGVWYIRAVKLMGSKGWEGDDGTWLEQKNIQERPVLFTCASFACS